MDLGAFVGGQMMGSCQWALSPWILVVSTLCASSTDQTQDPVVHKVLTQAVSPVIGATTVCSWCWCWCWHSQEASDKYCPSFHCCLGNSTGVRDENQARWLACFKPSSCLGSSHVPGSSQSLLVPLRLFLSYNCKWQNFLSWWRRMEAHHGHLALVWFSHACLLRFYCSECSLFIFSFSVEISISETHGNVVQRSPTRHNTGWGRWCFSEPPVLFLWVLQWL